MAEFEKDYVMRQTKLAVKGLSVFLKDESVDEIMQWMNSRVDKRKSQKRKSSWSSCLIS